MPETVPALFHYTTAEGLAGILSTMKLRASTKATSPRDVRHGHGQYFTDAPPGSLAPLQLSSLLVGFPWLWRKYTHFHEVATQGLNPVEFRKGIFVVNGEEDLSLEGRIVASGAVLFPEQL